MFRLKFKFIDYRYELFNLRMFNDNIRFACCYLIFVFVNCLANFFVYEA